MIPRATPVPAPVIKPRMVTLVMEGMLPTIRKPATAIHKVQRTTRMFMGCTPDGSGLPYGRCIALEGNYSIGQEPYYWTTRLARPTQADRLHGAMKQPRVLSRSSCKGGLLERLGSGVWGALFCPASVLARSHHRENDEIPAPLIALFVAALVGS